MAGAEAIAHTEAAAYYVHWGVIQISLANLLIIIAMVVLFVLALVVPFPGSRQEQAAEQQPRAEEQRDERG